MDPIQLLTIVILFFSVVIHEVSHGLAAYWLGDPTAKYAGRLTLNPLSHIDPIGSVFFPLLLLMTNSPVLFGWAKPVPYNPYNLKNQKYGPALVGVAGPLSNVLLALVAGIVLRALLVSGYGDSGVAVSLLAVTIFINILLTVFNLLPFPPLDGSKLLFSVLPISENTKYSLERYGFVFLFVMVFLFSNVISSLVTGAVSLFSDIIVGVNIFDLLG